MTSLRSLTRHRATRAATVMVLSSVLLLAGCGSDDEGADTGSDAGSATGSAVPSGLPQISEELEQCLAEQGVSLPSEMPTGMPSEMPNEMPSLSPDMQAAAEACADLVPDRAGGSGVPGVDQSALDAFASCMADNGVQVEASLEAVAGLDQEDATVSAALETCSPLLQP
jgi:hypothetical protein